MMFKSLQRLVALPGETEIYCGHEYSESNARFALTIDPENSALKERAKEIKALREGGPADLADDAACARWRPIRFFAGMTPRSAKT